MAPTPRLVNASLKLSNVGYSGLAIPHKPSLVAYAMCAISDTPVAEQYITLAFGKRSCSACYEKNNGRRKLKTENAP